MTSITKSAGTIVDDDATGTVAWSDTNNAKTDDSNYSSATSTAPFILHSHYLKATNLGFSIPTGATIDGITVNWKKRGAEINKIKDEHVKLIDSDGSILTTNKADTSTWWLTTSNGYNISYGGSSDLWSETWSASDINNSEFGVALAVYLTSTFGISGETYYVSITIDYTATESSNPTISNISSISGVSSITI